MHLITLNERERERERQRERETERERTASRRGRYLHNTQQTQETNILAPDGIRTRNPSNRAAADPSYTVRPPGAANRIAPRVKYMARHLLVPFAYTTRGSFQT